MSKSGKKRNAALKKLSEAGGGEGTAKAGGPSYTPEQFAEFKAKTNTDDATAHKHLEAASKQLHAEHARKVVRSPKAAPAPAPAQSPTEGAASDPATRTDSPPVGSPVPGAAPGTLTLRARIKGENITNALEAKKKEGGPQAPRSDVHALGQKLGINKAVGAVGGGLKALAGKFTGAGHAAAMQAAGAKHESEAETHARATYHLAANALNQALKADPTGHDATKLAMAHRDVARAAQGVSKYLSPDAKDRLKVVADKHHGHAESHKASVGKDKAAMAEAFKHADNARNSPPPGTAAPGGQGWTEDLHPRDGGKFTNK